MQDIWQEVAERRLADARSPAGTHPHAYNPERDKWLVQNPDDLHLMREARLVAP